MGECLTMDSKDIQQYYVQNFVKDSVWNTSYPNFEEAIRAGKILPLVSRIAMEHYSQFTKPFRIIDVGCGRGWLTALLRNFGTVVGIEPVSDVVAHAQRLFPDLKFIVSTPGNYFCELEFEPFDMVVCSEVVEHVPYNQQKQFLEDLASLVVPNGYLLLTTPRGELFSAWVKKYKSIQPIEDWLKEEQLDVLIRNCNLEIVERDRCYPTTLRSSYFRWFRKRPLRKLLSYFGYQDATHWMGMIYQVVLLRK